MKQKHGRLYRYHIVINRGKDQIVTHPQRSRGVLDPMTALRNGLAALGQLLTDGDWWFCLTVKNRGTNDTVFRISDYIGDL